jgi:hypothetical protein
MQIERTIRHTPYAVRKKRVRFDQRYDFARKREVFPKRAVLSPDYYEDYLRSEEPFWDVDPDYGSFIATGVPPRLRTMVKARKRNLHPDQIGSLIPGKLQPFRSWKDNQIRNYITEEYRKNYAKKRGIDRAVDRITGRRFPLEINTLIGDYIYDPDTAPIPPMPE